MRKLIVLLYLLSCYTKGFTQYISPYDSVLLNLYANKNYSAVMHQVDSSLKNGNNTTPDALLLASYAAFYNRKTYKQQRYLQLAAAENPMDSTVAYHLYFSLIENKQFEQARAQLVFLQKHKFVNAHFKTINYFAGITLGGKQSNNNTLYQPMYFTDLTFATPIRKVSTFHQLGYLAQKTHFGNIAQTHYYVHAAFPLKHNILIVPAFHIAQYNITNYPTELQGNPLLKSTSWLWSIEVRKQINNWWLSLQHQQADINQQKQTQYTLGIYTAPLGNSRLITGINSTYQTTTKKLIPSVFTRAHVTKRLDILANWLVANSTYFTEQNGLVLNNTFDATKTKWSIGGQYVLTKNLAIDLAYQNETKEEAIQKTTYQLHLLLLNFKTIF